MELQTSDPAKRRFVSGMLLAWIPLMFFIVPSLIAIISAFSHISSNQKATGLGAVAGGISESLATFGLAVFVTSEVAAIIFLLRTFSKGHTIRSVLAVFSICCSGIMLSILALLWYVIARRGP